MNCRSPSALAAVAAAVAASGVAGEKAPWPRHTVDNGALGADGVRSGDVDGDGREDLVTAWEISGDVRIAINPGPCESAAAWPSATIAIVPGCEDTLPTDLDGDGAVDLVTCAERTTRAVYVHWASRGASSPLDPDTWTTERFPSPPALYWMYAAPVQLDDQNGVDLVIASKNESPEALVDMGWLRAPIDPRSVADWTYVSIGPVGWIMSIIVQDMDGDGDPDLLLFDRFAALRAVRWLVNPGPGHVGEGTAWESVVVGLDGQQVVQGWIADIDGDGLLDVIGAARLHRLSWFERLDASGRKWEEHPIDTPQMTGAIKAVRALDVDLDGRLDIVVTSTEAKASLTGVFWLRQPENAVSFRWDAFDIAGTEGNKFDAVVTADFDGDGDADVAATDEHDNTTGVGLGLVWYENPTIDITPDIDGDGVVGFTDLLAVLDDFGQSGPDLAGDVNHDGHVGFEDVLIVVGQFNTSVCAP